MTSSLGREALRRFHPNNLADWPVMPPPGPAFPTPAELHYLQKKTDRLTEIIQDDWPASLATQNDPTVYEGAAGAAFMFLRLWETGYPLPDKTNALERAEEYIHVALRLLEERQRIDPDAKPGVTFVLGDAGNYALSAVIHYHQGRHSVAEEYVGKLLKLAPPPGPAYPLRDNWEPFYGLTGYLYSLYFVERHLGREVAPPELISSLVHACLESGLALAKDEESRPPLMYSWQGEKYVGLAHGIAGVAHTLLLRPRELDRARAEGQRGPDYRRVLEEAVDWLISLRFRDSGNYPAQLDDTDDVLVHWCHGAPGMSVLLCRVYQVFKHQRFLEAALAAGDVVWHRGLLKKGLGLCHGIAGNGYVFLELFKVTGDRKHLWRAWKFAEFALSPEGEEMWNVPSQPYSLFLGLAGTVCFLADLAALKEAHNMDAVNRIISFPACDL